MDDDSSIHVIDVDGTGTETLLGGDGYAYKHPRWVTAAGAPEREAREERATPDAEEAAANLAEAPGRLLYQHGYSPGSYTAHPDGGNEQLLVADSTDHALSYDGRWLTFRTAEAGTFVGTIVLIDTTTGDRREFGRGFAPVPSPDGSRIAYWEALSLDEGSHLVIVDVATGQQRAIYAEPGWQPEAPSWSPDGTKIAIFHETVSLATADHAAFEVVIIDPAKGETTVVAETSGGFLYSGPAIWSPDGTRIAFDDTVLRVAYVTGGGTRDYDVDADSVTWSPDGQRLAAKATGIYLVDAESGDVERLTNDVGGCVCDPPAWSPDGEWLAYSGADGTLRVTHLASETIISPGTEADEVRWLAQ
jgi:Tol biopolymer transport system component